MSSNAVLAIFPALELTPPTYLFEIDSSAVPGGFQPLFLARDSSNNLYVTDYNDRVVKLASNLHYLTRWGSCCSGNSAFYYPSGIAVDGSNNVYVADGGNSRIEKFDSNGNYLTQWGSPGTNNGQFVGLTGIAVDRDNNVYVADGRNSRIEKFDSSGNYLTQWGSRGSGNGQFESPEGIAVDDSNHVYVVDGYDRVEKFTSSGIYLTQWGSSGSGNGQFGNPLGIAVDSSGNGIYVADRGYSRIEVFVNNANIVAPILTNQPASQTVPAGSNVTFSVGVVGTAPFSYQWSFKNVVMPGATNATLTLTNLSLSASGAYSVLVTNNSGSELSDAAVLTVLPASDYIAPTYLYEIDYSAVPGGFFPNFVALDGSNNVYVTDALNNRVEKFSSSGNYLMQWGGSGSGNGQFDFPCGIAVDSSNNVYVGDAFNDRVEKLTSNGNYLTQWGPLGTNNSQFNYSEAVAVDSNNNVYVVDDGNNRVEKFDSVGNYLLQWGGQFTGPAGIALDSSNNVYVTDRYNSRVVKFDSNGNYLMQWGGYGTNNGQFYYPFGIAVDGGNFVYVVDSNNSRVEKFYSSGEYLTQWGSYGSGNGQFENPRGIAVDSSGNFVYVADWSNSRIQVFVNNPSIVPPIITSQPMSQTVPVGTHVTFSVGLAGTASFAYQWTSNNIVVPGATNATFTLTHVSLSASGVYSVLVTNNLGSELSSNAVLTVVPSLVTTQPASDLSAAGAVLNGSAYVGVESLVWFEWGTDTNYGNITGVTVVAGNNGSTNISVPLNGLPGNFYHYRMDAANDFGIVYGQDRSFIVGFAPSATTLPPTNSANGATLNAIVNPEGWDTTVYFQWGTSTLTNTTPVIDIGAGVTPLSVSNFVPGLSIPYKYRVVASSGRGTTFGELIYGDSGQAYLFSRSKTNITLPPGTYIITAYGAAGGYEFYPDYGWEIAWGGLGAEMSAEFYFPTSTTLTLLVGGFGDYSSAGYYGGGGGGGGSFVVEGSTPLIVAGGGGICWPCGGVTAGGGGGAAASTAMGVGDMTVLMIVLAIALKTAARVPTTAIPFTALAPALAAAASAAAAAALATAAAATAASAVAGEDIAAAVAAAGENIAWTSAVVVAAAQSLIHLP